MGRGGSNPAAPFCWSVWSTAAGSVPPLPDSLPHRNPRRPACRGPRAAPRHMARRSAADRGCSISGRASSPARSVRTATAETAGTRIRNSSTVTADICKGLVEAARSEAAEIDRSRTRAAAAFDDSLAAVGRPNCRSNGDDRTHRASRRPASMRSTGNRAASLMIEAGLRDMTVSMNDAQFLRSAHQSCTRRGAFKAPADISCFRNVSSPAG